MMSSLWPFMDDPRQCPNASNHRAPYGPCEDIGQCSGCGMMTFALRPAGETFGFHERNCSLPEVHEGYCLGGGEGHEPKTIRGYWPGYEDDVKAEREWWESKNRD